MTKPTIKHRYTGAVLFEGEAGMTTREMLEKATAAKANLRFADLRSANLRSANLRSANLSSANLSSANLSSANLRSADLSSADLSFADLRFADLRFADLSSANLRSADLRFADLRFADLRSADLDEKKLIGYRPFFSIGPIGSRSDYVHAWITDAGVMIRAGCFFDTRAQFELALDAEHGDNEHGQEYRAALVLIDAHAKLWTPATETPAISAKEVAA